MELLSLLNIPPMQVSVGVSPAQTAQEMKLQWQTKEAVVWKLTMVSHTMMEQPALSA